MDATLSEAIPLNPLTLVGNGGPPPTDEAALPRLGAPAGEGEGLHVGGEPGWAGQPDHGQAVEGGAVGAVQDGEVRVDVLLGALLQGHVVVSQSRRGVGPARTAW